jgi:hypothetical protein
MRSLSAILASATLAHPCAAHFELILNAVLCRLKAFSGLLAFGVLGRASGLSQANFLTLDFASVPRNKARLTQSWAQTFIVAHKRARQTVTYRTGLACRATTRDPDRDIEFAFQLRQFQRLPDYHSRGFAAKKQVEVS